MPFWAYLRSGPFITYTVVPALTHAICSICLPINLCIYLPSCTRIVSRKCGGGFSVCLQMLRRGTCLNRLLYFSMHSFQRVCVLLFFCKGVRQILASLVAQCSLVTVTTMSLSFFILIMSNKYCSLSLSLSRPHTFCCQQSPHFLLCQCVLLPQHLPSSPSQPFLTLLTLRVHCSVPLQMWADMVTAL